MEERAGPVQMLKMHIPKKYLLRDIGDGIHKEIIGYLLSKHRQYLEPLVQKREYKVLYGQFEKAVK